MTASDFISSRFESQRPLLSVEFYPPKSENGAQQILATARELTARFAPDFVSMTYGAGGSTRDRTIRYGQQLQEEVGLRVMPHLTCVGSSRDDLRGILAAYKEAGFREIMTLRGDPPKGQTDFQPHPDGLRYADELARFIHAEFPQTFCLGVAGYPERHPESASWENELRHLKSKVDAGGDFITTQMFFDNRDFFAYRDRIRHAGIDVPVVAGLMPIANLKPGQTDFFGAAIPEALREQMHAAGDDTAAKVEIGARWCFDQIADLIESDVQGVHLYIMNRSDAALRIVDWLADRFPEKLQRHLATV